MMNRLRVYVIGMLVLVACLALACWAVAAEPASQPASEVQSAECKVQSDPMQMTERETAIYNIGFADGYAKAQDEFRVQARAALIQKVREATERGHEAGSTGSTPGGE